MIMTVDKNVIANQICSTSIQLFRDRGFEQVSVNEICKNVGITKPTFYKYVHSKGDILTRYYFQIPPFHPQLDPENEKNNDYMQAIVDSFENSFRYFLSLGTDLLKAHMISQSEGMTMLNQGNSQWGEEMLGYIRKGQEYGQITNPLPPEALLDQMLAVLLGYAYYICTEGDESDLELIELKGMLETVCTGSHS